MCTKPTWARYHASSWDAVNRRWLDMSGNNRHTVSTLGTVQIRTASGDGATVPLTYLHGDVNAKILFPQGSIPGHYTICVLSRYNGGTRNRIFGAYGQNWKLGHWSGQRGRAYHDWIGWLTDDIGGTGTDWLTMCWKNPGGSPGNVLINGRASGKFGTNFWANWQMSLNSPSPYEGEVSDWAAAHAIIWDSALSDDDMAHVSNSIFQSLTTSTIDVPTLGMNTTTCRCYIPLPECSASSSTGPRTACSNCTRCLPGAITSPLCSATSCMFCPYGTWSTSPKASACTYCTAGTYAMSAGSTTCFTCLASTYGPFAGMSACFNVSNSHHDLVCNARAHSCKYIRAYSMLLFYLLHCLNYMSIFCLRDKKSMI
jgi:hypothetical protein